MILTAKKRLTLWAAIKINPTKGKYILWSLVTSANGTNEVGNNETTNQINPNAIGRVSFFTDVLIIVVINAATNIKPHKIRSSKTFLITTQSESALKFPGIKKAKK